MDMLPLPSKKYKKGKEWKEVKKVKRNPEFTIDEAQTATPLVTEGTPGCHVTRLGYRSPRIRIRMCDRNALLPAERVFKTAISGPLTR